MVPLNRVTTSSVGNRGPANEDGKQTGLDEMNFKPVKCMMIIIMLGRTEKKRLAAFSGGYLLSQQTIFDTYRSWPRTSTCFGSACKSVLKEDNAQE